VRIVRKLTLGCLLPLAFVAGISWWGWSLLKRDPPPAARYEAVSRGAVELLVTETGVIEPLRKVEIKSKVAGRILKLYVQEGDKVAAGALVADIDPTEIDSQVEQMRAQLDGAAAQKSQAETGVTYQQAQTRAAIEEARQSLSSDRSRLQMAIEEERVQGDRTESEIEQARASLRSAEESRLLLIQSSHPQALVQARTAYEDARVSAGTAKRNMDRQKGLVEKGFAAKQALDAAESELAASEARLQQAKSRLDTIEDQNKLELAAADSRVAEAKASVKRAETSRSLLPVKAEEVKAARASVRRSEAQLAAAVAGEAQNSMRADEASAAAASVRQIQNQLREVSVRQQDTRLRATMSGTVTRRYIEEGELVTSGVSTFSSGTPVLQVADLSSMLVKMSVNEVDVHKVRVGLPVEVRVDGAKDVVFKGRVRRVAPAAGAAVPQGDGGGQAAQAPGGVIRFAVEALVERADARLRPGMSAKCTVVIKRRTDVLRIPRNCVKRRGSEWVVQKLIAAAVPGKSKERVSEAVVRVGLEGDSHAEALSGLREGERLKPYPFQGPKREALDINVE
jgi:HlyD family secretion protein